MKKLIYFIAIIMCTALWSCKSVKYVEKPVEVEKVKTVYQTLTQHDSVSVHDSVLIYSKGDTVYNTRLKTQYRYIARHDTLIQRDTIPQVVTFTEIKEVNVLKNWQKLLMLFGGIALAISGLYIGFKLKKIL